MSSHLKYWYLKNHQLFRNLNFSEIDGLCILKKFKKSKKSEIVDLPFSEKSRVYFLKQGAVKLVKLSDEGDEIVIDFLQKGDMFGELGLGEDQPTGNEYIKVLSDEAIICTFYREALEELMLRKPQFALSYVKFLGFSIKRLKNNYKNIFFKDAKTRLLLLLDSIMQDEGSHAAASDSYELPKYLTQQDVAQLICTTRQTVIKLYHDLEKENIIHFHKDAIIINANAVKNFVVHVK